MPVTSFGKIASIILKPKPYLVSEVELESAIEFQLDKVKNFEKDDPLYKYALVMLQVLLYLRDGPEESNEAVLVELQYSFRKEVITGAIEIYSTYMNALPPRNCLLNLDCDSDDLELMQNAIDGDQESALGLSEKFKIMGDLQLIKDSAKYWFRFAYENINQMDHYQYRTITKEKVQISTSVVKLANEFEPSQELNSLNEKDGVNSNFYSSNLDQILSIPKKCKLVLNRFPLLENIVVTPRISYFLSSVSFLKDVFLFFVCAFIRVLIFLLLSVICHESSDEKESIESCLDAAGIYNEFREEIYPDNEREELCNNQEGCSNELQSICSQLLVSNHHSILS
jgi:hypothetical protein